MRTIQSSFTLPKVLFLCQYVIADLIKQYCNNKANAFNQPSTNCFGIKLTEKYPLCKTFPSDNL